MYDDDDVKKSSMQNDAAGATWTITNRIMPKLAPKHHILREISNPHRHT